LFSHFVNLFRIHNFYVVYWDPFAWSITLLLFIFVQLGIAISPTVPDSNIVRSEYFSFHILGFLVKREYVRLTLFFINIGQPKLLVINWIFIAAQQNKLQCTNTEDQNANNHEWSPCLKAIIMYMLWNINAKHGFNHHTYRCHELVAVHQSCWNYKCKC